MCVCVYKTKVSQRNNTLSFTLRIRVASEFRRRTRAQIGYFGVAVPRPVNKNSAVKGHATARYQSSDVNKQSREPTAKCETTETRKSQTHFVVSRFRGCASPNRAARQRGTTFEILHLKKCAAHTCANGRNFRKTTRKTVLTAFRSIWCTRTSRW